ncbi:MAG: ATP-binding cassette domain-containing protein [Smithellaceae bacterium]|nr:ATP-binding cassette domain-containing protein [Smithellaceae bacterium]
MTPTPIIEGKGLTKTYGDLTAVRDISFTVFPGECFGILGPNGAGKTSTIKMLYGLSPLTSGSLQVFGLDIERRHREIKARIGVCQQENNLDPDLTLSQNLEIFARYFDIPTPQARQRTRELLAFMALDHRRDAKAVELSGGMMRRTVLARSLINDPELLILDEPTTGLDPQSRHQVWERLEELKTQGLTILLTTHYMDEAARLCDRLIIMDQGRILVEGKPLTLIEKYVGQDVIEVVHPHADLGAFLKERQLPHEDLKHRIVIHGNGSDRLYQEIRERFCRDNCIMRMATLEDVFLKLTGRELRD